LARSALLFAALVAGCSTALEEGITVAVVLAPPSASAPAPPGTTEATSLGYQVSLTRAFVAIAAVELLPCAEAPARSIYLHSLATPTRLGTQAVESLLAPADSRLQLGELRPPPGRYCKVRQQVAPADSDALGLPSEVDMVGVSMRLEGTFARPGGAAQNFALRSTAAFDADVEIPPLELTPGQRKRATLVLTRDARHWLDGIDFLSPLAEDQARTALGNLRLSLRAGVE
jgi:hypothetical protein